MSINTMPKDTGWGQEPVARNTGGGFPPARNSRQVTEANAALPGNDKGNPVSSGNGGIPASLRIKKAGTKDTPGTEKTVNTF